MNIPRRPLTPLVGAVGVTDRHTDHDDWLVGGDDGRDTRDTSTSSYDHGAADAFTQESIGRTDAVHLGRRDGGCLEPETGLHHRGRRFSNDAVVRLATVSQGKIKMFELEADAK